MTQQWNSFGNQPTPTFSINFTPTTNTSTSVFGSNNIVPTTQTNTVFGSNLTGTTTKFSPVIAQETMQGKNKISITIQVKLYCICAMKEYINKSMEELRFEDYQSNRKFPSASSVFSTTNSSLVFGPTSTASTTTSFFGGINTTALGASSSGSNISGRSNTSNSALNPPISTIPSTSVNPWSSQTFTGFNTPVSITLGTPTNVWGSTNSTGFNPFGTVPNQPMSTASFNFPPQSTANTNIFTQTTPAQPPASTSSFIPINWFNNPIPSTSTANTNIFTQTTPAQPPTTTALMTSTNWFNNPVPSTSTANTNIFTQTTPAQPPASTSSFIPINWFNNSVPSTSTATSILNTTPISTTTTPNFNSLWAIGLPTSQAQTPVTSSSVTVPSQILTLEQNTQQSVSTTQQQFLLASLLDPYANRGRKDFINNDQIQALTESAAASTLSTTTNTTTMTTLMPIITSSSSIVTSTSVTTTAPIPITIPIQSNVRKGSSSRSSVDVNFKLKPVSSSPTRDDDTKPLNKQPAVSSSPVRSTLAGHFTDEEELILLSRNKFSKLRLSNDIVDTSYQSDSIRSLYPVRRLAELENFTRTTTPPPPSSLSSSPTSSTINVERISRSSNENRDLSPSHRSISSASPQRSSASSSPMIQRKVTNYSETYRLPILTREYYYMKPNLSELKTLFNDRDQCILKQFTVGHEEYGSVTFYGQFDVAGLNLDEIIEINRHEVIVYPDDKNKPSVGEELNRPARITLLGVYPVDRATHNDITDIERIKAANYTDYLRDVTTKFGGEFINYGMQDGSWTFMVKHFTRYGLDDNQHEC